MTFRLAIMQDLPQIKKMYCDIIHKMNEDQILIIGSQMLTKAKETTRNLGAEYLRLFVVDINVPAINLYAKNGFTRANGVYNEVIDSDCTLRQFGYEMHLY